jgi:hypothetical protein
LRNISESDLPLPIGVPELTRQMTGHFRFAARKTPFERNVTQIPRGDFSRSNIGLALPGKIRQAESAPVDFN